MIRRNIQSTLMEAATHYPVVTVTGPRQSGKTTLVQNLFPDMPYVSFEPLDAREYARTDPRGLIQEYRAGAILDEVQHVPSILSYIQEEVDKHPEEVGRFILTGSSHFGLSQAISQSLAGRTAVLTLPACSYDALLRFDKPPTDLLSVLWTGGYPRIHDRHIPADRWMSDYLHTYVERDVRQVLQVKDLTAFSTFLGLCAGRTSGVLNLSSIGADAGLSHNTVRSWLSVLETAYLAIRVPAFHASIRKQLVKSPKLHFLDSGLVCHLLGIHQPEQLRHHPLKGAVFESWVVSEVYKAVVSGGASPEALPFPGVPGKRGGSHHR